MTKRTLENPRIYVEEWMAKPSNSDMLTPSTFSVLWLDYLEDTRSKANKIRLVRESDMQKAFDLFLIKLPEIERKKTGANLVRIREDLTPLNDFLMASCGEVNEISRAVLAHWLWQVKRKLMDMEVIHHVMPIFVGQQGGGKSKAISNLLGPLKKFQCNLKMNQVGDERIVPAMADNYIGFFDELAGVQYTSMEELKNRLTSDFNTYRPLYKNYTVTVPMRMSFIGASNVSIAEAFSDSTGMRRFFEIKTLPVLTWDAINSINYVELWKGIDETKNKGYLEGDMLKAVQVEQQQYVRMNDLDLFLEENDIVPATNGHILIKYKDMYRAYKMHSIDAGYKPSNQGRFGKQLDSRNFKYENAKNEVGSLIKHVIVDSKCTLLAFVDAPTKILKFRS